MKTEAEVVRKIRKHLEGALRGAVIFKLQDYMTHGIPDLVVNYLGRVTWVEVKLLRPKETQSQFKKHFDALQLATLKRLSSQVRAYYFIAYKLRGQDEAVVVSPGSVDNLLASKIYDVGNLQITGEYLGSFNGALDHLVYLASKVAT